MSERQSNVRHRVTGWAVLIVAWAGAVGVGLGALMKYSSTPGPQPSLPERWPAELPFRPQPKGITLLVSLHPRCPCSRATLGELARLMTLQASGVQAYLLMVQTSDAVSGRELTDLWQQTRDIPGVVVMPDRDGVVSRRLGAHTSGQVFAFDPSGRALFSGGITPARSHMGDSAGGDALRALLRGHETAGGRTAPVFGCSLDNPQATSLAGGAP
jgi:hypothetical protein